MLRIAVVEDEPHYAEQLCNYIQTYQTKNDITCSVSCFSSGIDFLESYSPCYELILLDIVMPHMSGMDMAHKLREVDDEVPIIFITNMAQYAIRGYEVDAMDFMIKPVKYTDFEMKLNKVRRRLKKRPSASITLRLNGTIKKLPVMDILYVEVLNHSLTYHTREGSYTIPGQLKELLSNDVFNGFAKCKSCYLVNLAYVTQINTDSIVVGGCRLELSRRMKKAFLGRLAQSMGGTI